jgi:hypothetical protein
MSNGWSASGESSGWLGRMKETLESVLEPEVTNPEIPRIEGQNESGRWVIDEAVLTRYVDKPAADIDMGELEKLAVGYHTSDPDLLLGVDRAIQWIKAGSGSKMADGLKIVLHRILRHGDPAQRKAGEAVLRMWYRAISGRAAV